jgi:helix-turn-helix protein
MANKKFVTIIHNALGDAERIDVEMRKLKFDDSFIRDGKKVTFPTSPIRLYFTEAEGDAVALRDHYMDIMHNIWEKLEIKSGIASVLVGDNWQIN